MLERQEMKLKKAQQESERVEKRAEAARSEQQSLEREKLAGEGEGKDKRDGQEEEWLSVIEVQEREIRLATRDIDSRKELSWI